MKINSKLSSIVQTLLPSARIERFCLPLSSLNLFLLNADYPQHALPQEVALQLMEQPLYWAFCWASGDVMARYILDNPAVVKNKTVLDFGSGSGVVAIAAAKAGAHQVIACDNDPNAVSAIRENAQLNNVTVTVLDNIELCDTKLDVLLAADVLYDRENLSLLDTFLTLADQVLVADSRIKNFHHSRFLKIGEFDACTVPDLDESKEFRRVSLYTSQ